MMPAAKHLDPVMGVDIHIIMIPSPAGPIPTPLPNPFIGFILDPFDYLPIIGSTIKVNGMNRAIAGTAGRTVPGVHLAIGGPFMKPPANECEMFMGSSTVQFDGDPASYLALPALSCQDIGMVPPFRMNPKKGTKLKTLVLPLSVVLPIPAGPPVLIGGPPTISLLGVAMKLGLLKLLKKVGKGAMAVFKKGRQALFKGMKPGFLKCLILRAEPVNILTGEVDVEQQDFTVPGRLPIEWNRHYSSEGTRQGVCGRGWDTVADARLEFQPDGPVLFFNGGAGATVFPERPDSGPVLELLDGAMLDQREGIYTVTAKDDRVYRFAKPQQKSSTQVLAQSISDLCGNTITFERGEEGVTAIRESSGRWIEVVSARGLIQEMWLRYLDGAVRHPLVRYDYDAHGQLTTVYDALGEPYRFKYEHLRLAQHTDRRGLSFYYEYDTPPGEPARVTHAWGDGGLYNYRFEYLDALAERRITDSLGHVSIVKLDERGLPISEIDPLGGVTLFEYDEVGRTTALVDPEGHRTEYEYDERGNVLKLTRPDSATIQTDFDSANKAVKIVDPNGATWEQKWDARGSLLEQTSPLGNVSRYEYDRHGQLVAFINPRNARTELQFDALGNLATLKDALGHTTTFSYDILGNVEVKRDPLGHETRYSYDVKGRLTDARSPSGATVSCGYDGEDNLVRYVDENNAETRLEYAGLGEIAKRIQADGSTVQYHYDTEERLIGVTNQRGETYQLKRNALGLIVDETDYWGQVRRYAYDASGYLVSSTDPLNRTIRYATDALGRILKKTLPDGFIEHFAYDASGNLTEAKNPHTTIKRRLDPEGRLLEEVQGSFTMTNRYDENGNRIILETSLGNTVAYEFDALDQVVSVRINTEAPIKIDRDPAGRITYQQLSQSVSQRFGYTADSYLAELAVSSSGLSLFTTRFEYDPAGNLTKRSDSEHGTDVYTYDMLGRITEHLDPHHRLAQYLNDPAGDRLRTRVVQEARQRIGGSDVTDAEWERVGEYGGVYYRFDRAGNLIQRRDRQRDYSLVWDANQQLIEIWANADLIRYGYDPLGRRCFTEIRGQRTLFFWDGNVLLVETTDQQPDSAGDRLLTSRTDKITVWYRHFVYYPATFEPLLIVDGASFTKAIYHFHNDPNGCPRRVTNDQGVIYWAVSYTAWGKASYFHSGALTNPLRLQGQYADEATDFHYNVFRYFDPVPGQYISIDPLRLDGGSNIFALGTNALAWIDPVGLKCYIATRNPIQGVIRGRQLSQKQALQRIRRGLDVIADSASEAASLAKRALRGKPMRHAPHGPRPLYLPHYHPSQHANAAHVFFP